MSYNILMLEAFHLGRRIAEQQGNTRLAQFLVDQEERLTAELEAGTADVSARALYEGFKEMLDPNEITFINGRVTYLRDVGLVTIQEETEQRSTLLSQLERLVFEQLIIKNGTPVKYSHLVQTIWGAEDDGVLDVISPVINHIRAKIEPNKDDPKIIHTVRKVGYMVNEIPAMRRSAEDIAILLAPENSAANELVGTTIFPEKKILPEIPLLEGRIVIDPNRKTVTVDGDERHLPPAQYKLLLGLYEAQGNILTKEDVSKVVGGTLTENGVRVAIRMLRRLVEPDPNKPLLIETHPGYGYAFALEKKLTEDQ